MSDKSITTFIELLAKNNLSQTTARRLVFESLVNSEPLSMAEILNRINRKIDRASVYRTINLFESLAIVNRLNYGWKHKFELSDKFKDHHHHLTCINCGKIIAIEEEKLERFLDAAATENGFRAVTHQLEVQGYCSSCTTKDKLKTA